MALAPLNDEITIHQLTYDPYPIYQKLRKESPVTRSSALKRTLLVKYEDAKRVKDEATIFSSDDPNAPMKPAFQAHTLMRKDGREHLKERMAMMPAFAPKLISSTWAPLYEEIAREYLDRLPSSGIVDFFTDICGPVSARILAHILGTTDASDEEMQRWSQQLIDGAGNFAFLPEPFAITDKANAQMNALFEKIVERVKVEPDHSAFSIMVNAKDPIPMSQIYANIKIAIGGGINEPRDALATVLYGLLTNQDQLEEVKRTNAWEEAFDEGIRWVAPIQVSSRFVKEDSVIRGFDIPKGDTVMSIQASANRDEDYFEDGENFNVFRKKVPHQAFGSGPHHCAGAHVARRTVGRIILPMIFDRFPNISLPDPESVKWRGFGFRGPINLPLKVS